MLLSSFLHPFSPFLFHVFLSRRLDVSADPGTILNSTPPNTMVLCLQLCPHQKGSLFHLISVTILDDYIAIMPFLIFLLTNLHILHTISFKFCIQLNFFFLIFLSIFYHSYDSSRFSPSPNIHTHTHTYTHTHTHNQYCMRVWA